MLDVGRLWQLPWQGVNVPHAVLDVIRGCNISCRGCINASAPEIRDLAAVERDLDALLERRRLASLTILGGEPRLHPDLPAIVRLVKSRRVAVELLTNGLKLDDDWLRPLVEAGLDILYLHIDGGQRRPDLADDPTAEQLRALWSASTERVAAHGLDVGLAVTLYRDRLEDALTAVRFVLESPHVHYLLVTLFRHLDDIERIEGDIYSGMRARVRPDAGAERVDTLTNHQLAALLEERLGLTPFGIIGSNLDANDPRWLSYHVAVARQPDGTIACHCLAPSGFEAFYIAAQRRLSGRYPMYLRQNRAALVGELMFNALSGGDARGNLRFVRRQRGRPLLTKRLLFQCPAQVAADGRVIHCACCPDACHKQGRLVPICISDYVDNG
ncbi:MAG: radical SAM protein [Deltaproteobacteria bacterium]|nr:radical SAM protein [Deltaproteobacteria bacterium]